MKRILLFILIVAAFGGIKAQSKADTDKIFISVGQQPKFPGDINKYLADNIVYPPDAQKKNIQGTVYVSFVIEKDGAVSSAKVLRGVTGGEMLEKEAVRVVSAMPKWTPGIQDGKNVRVQYMVPIRFVTK